jgi:hypothetical protein
MIIKYNEPFKTIAVAMDRFRKTIGGKGPIAGFHWIVKDVLGAWFPKLARNTNGILTPGSDEWMNILAHDEKEITEIWIRDQERTPPHSKKGMHRAVFVKEENTDYRFKGIYALVYISDHGRTRVYTRLAKDFPDLDCVSDFKRKNN